MEKRCDRCGALGPEEHMERKCDTCGCSVEFGDHTPRECVDCDVHRNDSDLVILPGTIAKLRKENAALQD